MHGLFLTVNSFFFEYTRLQVASLRYMSTGVYRPWQNILLFFLTLRIVVLLHLFRCVHVYVRIHVPQCAYGGQKTILWGSLLSYHMCSGGQTQVVRLGSKCLLPVVLSAQYSKVLSSENKYVTQKKQCFVLIVANKTGRLLMCHFTICSP